MITRIYLVPKVRHKGSLLGEGYPDFFGSKYFDLNPKAPTTSVPFGNLCLYIPDLENDIQHAEIQSKPDVIDFGTGSDLDKPIKPILKSKVQSLALQGFTNAMELDTLRAALKYITQYIRFRQAVDRLCPKEASVTEMEFESSRKIIAYIDPAPNLGSIKL